MNKVLLRIAGVINLLFVLLHLSMVTPVREALRPLSPDIAATASTWNIQVAFTLVIFGYLAFFQCGALLTTRLGNITAIAMSMFWFLRAVNQVVFYGPGLAGLILLGICVVVGLLHLIPVLRAWKDVGSQAQPQVAVS